MKKKKINKNLKHITHLPIMKQSGFFPKLGEIEIAKKHCYTIIKDISVTGDAPKDIIRFYEYGKASKRNYKKWPIYIAKLGHKYYPTESITEQLITDIGLTYGFDMASSKICFIGGQIRFLSLYFLNNKKDELLHGADLYAGFLNNDRQFIDDIEENKMTQDFFTIKFTKEVLDDFFDENGKQIFINFMRMLFFDGLVGNNDRHMYNWGIVRDIFGKDIAVFSKIYDTARGLLWNRTEEQLDKIINNNNINSFVKKYCENSKPKIGIENMKVVNHFELIERYKEHYKADNFIYSIFANEMLENVINMIDKKYSKLLSKNRRIMIIEILKFRFNKIKEILDYEK